VRLARSGSIAAAEADAGIAESVLDDNPHVRAILAAAGMGGWHYFPSSGKLRCDATTLRILNGASAGLVEDAPGLLACFDAADRREVALRLELCTATGTALRYACRLARPDGGIRWVQLAASRVRLAAGDPVAVGTIQDITERKCVEDALRTSEARLATIFDQTMVGVLHRDRDRNVLMVNERYLEMIGRSEAELSGCAMEAFTHPEDRIWNTPLFHNHYLTGEPFTIEKRYVRPDGSIIWCELNVSFVPDPAGGWASTIVVAHDISARKAAEQERQRASDMLQLALDGAGAGMWECDLIADGLLRLSPASRLMYALPEAHSGEMSHAEWAAFIDPGSLAEMDAAFPLFCNAHIPHAVECKIHRTDGASRWLRIVGRGVLDDAGKPVRIVGLVYDDTERKRAEDDLREGEARLRLVQEAASIGTFHADPDGRTVGSKEYFRNLGLPEDTAFIDDATRFAIIHPDDRERVTGEIAAAVAGSGVYESEYRIVRHDTGEIRWVFVRAKLERDGEGRVVNMLGAHLDITAAKTAAEALRQSETFSKGIVEASADCIKLLDPDGTLRFMNESGLRTLEVDDPGRIYGKNWVDLWPPEARPKVEIALALARAGKPGRFDAGCPTATGKRRWWDVVVTPLAGEQGRTAQLLSISRDITEQRDHAERIRWAANHDALTQLPNRLYFQEALERMLCDAAVTGRKIGLMVLDIDDFKQVNDALGHDAGDALLRAIAQRLTTILRGQEFAVRLGGDEFAIVVPGPGAQRDLAQVGEAVLACLDEPVVHCGCVIDCRMSIGAAIYPNDGDDAEMLLKNADTALYAAKIERRGRTLLFQPDMRSEMDRRTAMLVRARNAFANHDILPHYQPKISLRTGAICGFEALLRWRDQDGTIRLPGAIEAAFEDLEVAQALSERMQDLVIADMRRWLDEGVDFGHVALNAAAAEFRRNDFAERLLEKLHAGNVPTRHLELEVTETVFLGRGADNVGRALKLLSKHGIHIALDDFGTGYASLSHLKDFPVDVIKIDRSFISQLSEDRSDNAIVLALLNLGESLRIQIVAEGIETKAQAEFLRNHGCDLGQGYLFSKAVDAALVPTMLAGHIAMPSFWQSGAFA